MSNTTNSATATSINSDTEIGLRGALIDCLEQIEMASNDSEFKAAWDDTLERVTNIFALCETMKMKSQAEIDFKIALGACIKHMEMVNNFSDVDEEWDEVLKNTKDVLAKYPLQVVKQASKEFTSNQMESAIEIANIAGGYGYQTPNSRDAMSQFLNWALEFDQLDIADDEWIERVEEFTNNKMLAQVGIGEAKFDESRLPSWMAQILSEKQGEMKLMSPEWYAHVLTSTRLKVQHGSIIEQAFAKRCIDVEQGLMEKGWVGKTDFGIISPNQNEAVVFKPTVMKIRNVDVVIGGVWHMMVMSKNHHWEQLDSMMDGLAKSPEFLVNKFHHNHVMNVVRGEQESSSLSQAVEIANNKQIIYPEDIFSQKTNGKIIGITDLHVVQNLGRMVAIINKADLDRIPKLNDEVGISFVNGKGKVAAKARETEVER